MKLPPPGFKQPIPDPSEPILSSREVGDGIKRAIEWLDLESARRTYDYWAFWIGRGVDL